MVAMVNKTANAILREKTSIKRPIVDSANFGDFSLSNCLPQTERVYSFTYKALRTIQSADYGA